MVAGEKSFSTSSVSKSKFSSEPFPAGDYSMKVLGDTAEIRKKEGDPKAFPYVNVALEALGTGKDGQKNRRVYHRFFLKLTPGKDGSLMPARADQLKGFSDALGEEIRLPVIQVNGEDILSPKALVEFLKAKDGEVFEAHVRITKGGEKYPDKNEVSEFIEADGSQQAAEEEEAELEEEEVEEVAEETEDADDEPAEEDEPEPLPPVKKKAVPVPVKKAKR